MTGSTAGPREPVPHDPSSVTTTEGEASSDDAASPDAAREADPLASEGSEESLARLRRFFWGLEPTPGDDGPWTPPALAEVLDRESRSPDPFVLVLDERERAPRCLLLPDLVDGLFDAEAPQVARENRLRFELALRRSADPGDADDADGDAADLSVRFERAAARIERELELPHSETEALRSAFDRARVRLPRPARLISVDDDTPGRVLAVALEARRRRSLAGLGAEVLRLREGLRALLERHGPAGGGRSASAAPGGRWFDGGALAGLPRTRPAALPPERRARIESCLARLADLETLEPRVRFFHADPPPDASEGDAIEGAAATFDREAARVVEDLRALRIARLELEDAFEPARHGPWIDALDWHAVEDGEAGLLPSIVLRLDEAGWSRRLGDLARLLASHRPIVVWVRRDPSPASAGPPARPDPGSFGLGLRDVAVLQASSGHPEHLVQGLGVLAASGRPALLVTSRTARRPAVPAWLAEAAAVDARAHPLFSVDPDAGSGWARRFALGPVPEPTLDWIRADESFTSADLALLAEPPVFPIDEGLDSPDLVPLAEWVDLPPDRAAVALPWIPGRGADGLSRRLLVGRELAERTRNDLDRWRALRELAGIRNEHVERAVLETRREDEADWTARIRAIEDRHADELRAVEGTAVETAIDRLVGALLDDARAARGDGVPRESTTPPAPETDPTPTVAPARVPEEEPGPPTSQPGDDEAPASPADTTPEAPEEAWIDSELCTSCGDCLARSSQVFAYDANKRAFVRDPRGASYAVIVEAAENCPARVIHPGTPLDPSEPRLEQWVERAAPYR